MTTLRVKEEVYELLKKVSEETGKSISEIASEAIKAYIKGIQVYDKEIKEITKLRPIKNKFPSKCHICGKELQPGVLVFYQKIVFVDNTVKPIVLCQECASDEDALASKYIKAFELQKTIRGLKRKADKLAQEILELSKLVSLKNIYFDIERELKLLREYLITYNHPKEAIEKVDNFKTKLEELTLKLDNVLEDIRELLIPKVKVKKEVGARRLE
jgi:Ribbon-helix-helix protein, copG family.